ncbi:uncharacterized protein LOC112026277 isoform X2 [Quercus suber]|uniref:uncharacterized protein LOC112026277 isoform X2 n=1 Tax=Quercus suber TaxID=58331 RepID=UPI0032DF2562
MDIDEKKMVDIEEEIRSLQLDSADTTEMIDEIAQHEELEKVDKMEEDSKEEVHNQAVEVEKKVKEKENSALDDEAAFEKELPKKRHLNVVFIGHVGTLICFMAIRKDKMLVI